MEEEEKLNRISTDVLIIGSGGAGLRTAIEARRHGANVLLVSKSKTGLATCTASAGGIFRVSEKEMDVERHFRQTIEAGRFLNRPDLVKILVSEGWNAVKELESFGIKLLVEKDKTSVIAERFPAGATLSRALSNYALSLGAKVLEKTIVFDLLVEEDRCLGALAFKRDSGEVIDISAKAVVLATGGYAGLYVRNDNPPTITGDGLALAFKAGAKLQDLEFVQFQPMFIDVGVPRMPILDWLIEATKNLVSGGSLVNNKGERFLAKYGLLEQEILRDNLTVAFEREISEDKNHKDSIVFDLRSLSSEEIEKAFDLKYQKSLVRPFTHILANRQLHVASTAHYTMGGVRINDHCETGIEGLYAVGEVTSGIHGANRLGGNALTEIMVFGKIAGQQAAKYAENAHFATIDEKRVKESERILQEFRSRTRNRKVNPSLVKSNVRTVVSNFCKPVRSREGLKRAEIELEQTEENASLMFAENSFQLKEAVEAQFMLTLAKLIVKSALARKESRGAHFRLDYPKCDDERWLKNIIVGQEKAKTTIRFEAVTHE